MPERYIIYSEGPDENTLKEALSKVFELCASLAHNAVILHVPGIKSLGGIIEEVFGKVLLKKLSKEKSITINNIKLTLNTESIKINNQTEDIVLSIYPTSKMFDNINDLKKVRAIVVVPYTEEERNEFIKTWNPVIIGKDDVEFQSLDIDPRLENALSLLTSMINLSTDLTHPSDREKTIQLLQLLYKRGINLNPNDMRIWALQNGWNSDGADKLHDIAKGVLEGKRFRTTGQSIWNDKIIDKILGN